MNHPNHIVRARGRVAGAVRFVLTSGQDECSYVFAARSTPALYLAVAALAMAPYRRAREGRLPLLVRA